MAIGLTREPVPTPIWSGATTNRNSQRPRAAQASASRSRRRLSSRWIPIPTSAHMWIGIGHSMSAARLASAVTAGVNENDVALFGVDAGGVELIRGDGVAGLEPVDSAEPWDVEQHAASHDAGVGDLDRAAAGTDARDVGGGRTVVHLPVDEDVAEGIDVADAVAVKGDTNEIARPLEPLLGGSEVAGLDHVVQRRVGVVDGRCCREGSATRDGDSVAY